MHRLGCHYTIHRHFKVVVTMFSCEQETLRGGVGRSVGAWRGKIYGAQHNLVPLVWKIDPLLMNPAFFEQRPILKPADIESRVGVSRTEHVTDFPHQARPGNLVRGLSNCLVVVADDTKNRRRRSSASGRVKGTTAPAPAAAPTATTLNLPAQRPSPHARAAG